MKEFYMKRAIELAEKAVGFVNPDPLVGAVLVKDNRVIGEGYHKEYGSPSAIEEILSTTKEEIDGAELYINLEPEFDIIVSSGIKKLYIGMLNPDKTKSNIEKFISSGIEVNVGMLKEECEELNEIYKHYTLFKTPFVFTKWAMTLDGKLATKTGDSKWISGEESLRFVHHLRQRVAAIMVGENTVRQDNPMLTTRLEGVQISNPLRVILSKYGDISPEANVLKVDRDTKTVIISSINIPEDKEKFLVNKGVQLIKIKEKNNRIEFTDIVKALGEMKIDSLYIEGGSSVLASAFESGVVNKVYAAIAPKIIGGKDAITPVGGVGIERMKDAIVLRNVKHEIVGNDVIFKGYI
ncbi:bifunctional diaminohydroxyphosphoribosylaminopyrimidine deaminase/5-amino-6-(5-phosphoribosylamino)uracil reductase RibD [Clostridium sp. 'White wine YQ']|uniref:bifunctional diaminohydroxyphosphoribosylaminopyrimidine deaminase/5-amino-6-(5-phosphoribosylamino)uracil reductase RibD n=1 Tax=Clostridium sp. 'White wine YQ' TaxID=3027474 RepID=UPI00236571B5|nr:bifunctional diaminohydroxyphosphoribosylaminopyrimidine deaminase/5-amino-6-(5-phosphoribosylamino)uracil reductase RibD [Clostridium sp. 'White wine YQ']MDD7795289.1 bifunctional diaminohydroxyphosphoribosylaminopyrimidine deaminase/5-amino-6-(5-phosphoribosylamino)uracil reductase RibD [Clostridium sp. 'White wine YQ']